MQLPASHLRLAVDAGGWRLVQNVVPTANLNLYCFSGWKLLSSTPARDGFIAKINRNGTFSTGMKNRISAPVETLNAATSSTGTVTLGSGLRRNGSTWNTSPANGVRPPGVTWRVRVSFHAK